MLAAFMLAAARAPPPPHHRATTARQQQQIIIPMTMRYEIHYPLSPPLLLVSMVLEASCITLFIDG